MCDGILVATPFTAAVRVGSRLLEMRLPPGTSSSIAAMGAMSRSNAGRGGPELEWHVHYDLLMTLIDAHEINLAPDVGTMGVTSVMGFRWTR